VRLDCKEDEKSARLNVPPLALYPLNDRAHSYRQLTFKDTSRFGGRVEANLNGSPIKKPERINRRKKK